MASNDSSPAGVAEGVYFVRSDYAGVGRRLVILVIDGSLLLFVFLATMVSYHVLTPQSPTGFHAHVLGYILASFLYLAVVARSRLGTLGYLVTGVRVVNLCGHVPSLSAMAYRSLFAVLGPLNGLLDLVWLSGDPNRQSIRDKLAGTYIVRRSAQPAGRGRLRHVTLSLFGYTLMVSEVGRDVT
jgi:uncharacterized RDD family membrane protein YckC